MKNFPLTLSTLLILFFACSNTKETEKEALGDEQEDRKENGDEREEARNRDSVPKVRLIEHEDISGDSDPFTFEGTKMDEDILRIVVSYSGGCEEHVFDLFSKGQFTKSHPPSVDVFLRHDANGDACRSLIVDTLRFDVSQLRHEQSEKVLLRFRDRDRPVEYAY